MLFVSAWKSKESTKGDIAVALVRHIPNRNVIELAARQKDIALQSQVQCLTLVQADVAPH
jgi:hypothetical protein